MNDCEMMNPASRIHQRRFLKKGSVDQTADSQRQERKLLTHKAIAVRKQRRSLSPSPPKIQQEHRRYVSTGIGTVTQLEQLSIDGGQSSRIQQLQQQNQCLKLQLKLKKSQMIQINLKYLALKQKMMQKDKSCRVSIPEFDDISNISSCNSISKHSKREELNAIKSRLAKLSHLATRQVTVPKPITILPKDL